MLTSLNVLMSAGAAAIGETIVEEEVVEEGVDNPEGACQPCIARVS